MPTAFSRTGSPTSTIKDDPKNNYPTIYMKITEIKLREPPLAKCNITHQYYMHRHARNTTAVIKYLAVHISTQKLNIELQPANKKRESNFNHLHKIQKSQKLN